MRKLVLLFIIFVLSLPSVFAASAIWANPKGLKVYIPPKDMLTTTMLHAFQEWQRKTNNYFVFLSFLLTFVAFKQQLIIQLITTQR